MSKGKTKQGYPKVNSDAVERVLGFIQEQIELYDCGALSIGRNEVIEELKECLFGEKG